MNIIIVGCGKVGQKLAAQLNKEDDINITVVDPKYQTVQNVINSDDVMGVVGSGVSLDTLMEAGIENADILIAVTGSDEINLLTCLIARKAGNCQTIARVRKPEYNKEINLFKDDLGLAMVINPEKTAANEIARVLKFPSAIQIDSFAKGRVEILKFRITEGNALSELAVSDIYAKLKCDVLVCGVERGEEAFIPGGDFILKASDEISIVASPENTHKFFKAIGIKSVKIKDTMIVGGGMIAYYLAKNLIKSGVSVKIVEQNAEHCDKLFQLLPKANIINGDGTDRATLLEEGIEHTGSFVALTNIDEENILISLYAKSVSDAKVVTKVNRITYDEVIDGLNLDTVIHPKDITAEYIVRFVRAKKNSFGCNIETMHLILDGKAEALEFRIKENSPIAGVPIEALSIRKNILITCINRNGKILTPRGKDIIEPGDTVIIVTTITGLKDISDVLEQRKK